MKKESIIHPNATITHPRKNKNIVTAVILWRSILGPHFGATIFL
jgi:hypothetical protein